MIDLTYVGLELVKLGGLVIYGNGGLYYMYYNLLMRRNAIFRGLEIERQMYVIKNLTKSTFLFLLAIISTPWVYELVTIGNWENHRIKFIGSVYVSTDIAGLLFVPDLPKTTKIHHTIVFFLGMMNILVDYQQDGIHRALIALTYFSILPYLVNTLLGLRFLGFPELKQNLALISYWVYGASIIINCSYQNIYTIFYCQSWFLVRIVYLCLYYMILYDDLKLLSYLYRVRRFREKMEKLK